MRKLSLATAIFLISLVIIISFMVIGLIYSRPWKESRFESFLHEDSIPTGYEISKTALINTIMERYGFGSYLEVGQGKPENNFNRIRCREKTGVDPDPACKATWCLTSDDFFRQNTSVYDLIFIDGLHHAEQVYRDIINALSCLNDKGIIVVHDCDPSDEAMQTVPQKQDIWTGDVWKAWVRMRSEREDLEMFVVRNSSGCGIIRHGFQKKINVNDTLTYSYLDRNRAHLLNYMSVNEFLSWLRK